jgi:hypothetical protein
MSERRRPAPLVERDTRVIDRPAPGFWAVRLAGGAPEVGAAILLVHTTFEPAHPTNLMDRSPSLAAYINGFRVSLGDVWERKGRQISEDEYRFLIADRDWARRYAPRSAEANPHQKADLRALPPVLPRRI